MRLDFVLFFQSLSSLLSLSLAAPNLFFSSRRSPPFAYLFLFELTGVGVLCRLVRARRQKALAGTDRRT
eukprot:m.288265 g.288265  ORF g.288265 m.288265 type:complete len:69 (-) comp55038_c0_seq4:10-216(-)